MILLVVLAGSVCAVAETYKTRLWWLPGAALLAFGGVFEALSQTFHPDAGGDAVSFFVGVVVAVMEASGAITLFALGVLMLALASVLRLRHRRRVDPAVTRNR